MFDESATRRLAAIVSVDVAGYSAMAEADEAAAVETVSSVAACVRDAAAAYGGRVFNSAGDGFMLEFPTASGALGAAQAIRASASARLRLAVHLGEVTVTGTGDLLGHGVNVAARIQHLARPGEILISDDVKRALRGTSSVGLASRGRVRLDKMSETTEVYAYGLQPVPRSGRPLRGWFGSRKLAAGGLAALAACALLAVVVITGFASRSAGGDAGAGREEPLRVAVLRIDAPPGEARTFARSLADTLRVTLADGRTSVVSRDAAEHHRYGGARLLVHGGAEVIGDRLRLRLQIDDAPAGLSVWALTLERPLTEASTLQDQAAGRVADVIDAAVRTFEDAGRPVDAETLGAFLKLWELSRLGRLGAPQYLPLARQVVAAAPNSAMTHAYLAYALAVAPVADPSMSGRQFQEARQEAERALALDANCGDAYAALASLVRPKDRMERLRLLKTGLKVDPQNPGLLYLLADLMREVGRTQEAASLHRLSLSIDPLSPSRVAANVFVLSATGAAPEAEALAKRWMAIWPDRPAVRRAAINSAMLYGTPDGAIAMLDAYQAGEPKLAPEAASAWRAYARARAVGVFPQPVLRNLRREAEMRAIDLSTAVAALAQAGDIDGAYALADSAIASGGPLYTSVLFEPAAAPMRRDPRFFPLVRRLGISDFWRKTGEWPDFCKVPGGGIDCQTAA